MVFKGGELITKKRSGILLEYAANGRQACRLLCRLYRPRFIGHSVAHIQAAFSTGLQAILLAWAGVR